VVTTTWLERDCDGVAQGWWDAGKNSTALLASQTSAASPVERKGSASPPGQSCAAAWLKACPFPGLACTWLSGAF